MLGAMDLAPSVEGAAAPVPAAPAPSADVDRARALARLAPREKAALLRAAIPRLTGAAPALAAAACAARGIDPSSPAAAGAWIAGPVAAVTHARLFAEALDDIASAGRPSLPAHEIRKREDGRVIARLSPRAWAERRAAGGRETYVVFEEGVEPEDVIRGQAASYRDADPGGAEATLTASPRDASGGILDALAALFVEGRAVDLRTPADRAALVADALAPLVEAGAIRVTEAHDAAASAARPEPVIVLPCLYAKAELSFAARSIASQIAHGDAAAGTAPSVLVIPATWAQKDLFFDLLTAALATIPPRPWALLPEMDAASADLDAAIASADHALPVIPIGGDAPGRMARDAVDLCNTRLEGGLSAQLVLHPIHEDDPEVAPAVERAVLALRRAAVGINQWPALLCFRSGAPFGARGNTAMLPRVDKAVLEGPLLPVRKPLYLLDNQASLGLAARALRFAARPGMGDLWSLAGR